MSKTPAQIAQEAINNLVVDLVKTRRAEPLTKDETINRIKKHIKTAYAQAYDKNEKDKIYRELARRVHPDKIEVSNPELYEYLVRLELQSEPQQLADKLSQAIDNQAGGLWDYLNDLYFRAQSMKDSLERYNEPVRSLSQVVFWGAASAMGIGAAAASIIYAIPFTIIKAASLLFNKVLNSMTQNQYAKELDLVMEQDYKHYQKVYLDNYRKWQKALLVLQNLSTTDLDAVSDETLLRQVMDEDFFEELRKRDPKGELNHSEGEILNIKKMVEDKLKQKIRDGAQINGLIKLKLVSSALYNSIANSDASLTSRVLRAFASPFILLAAAAIESARFITDSLYNITVIASAYAVIATLAILNTPLYIPMIFQNACISNLLGSSYVS